MTPDYKINDRYFAGAIAHKAINGSTFIQLDKSGICLTSSSDSFKEFHGDCFVELEKCWVGKRREREYFYQIKLDQQGKTVVLSELPKSNFEKAIAETYEKSQSLDELAEKTTYSNTEEILISEILKKHFILSPYVKDSIEMGKGVLYHEEQVIKAMQEYHRIKYEGLFTKEDMVEFAEWLNNSDKKYPIVTMFDNWLMIKSHKLESRKEGK